MVQVDSLEHIFVGERGEVVIDRLLLLKEHPFEEDIPVIFAVYFLDDGAALTEQCQPLVQDADELLDLEWLEIDLNGDVLVHQVLPQRGLVVHFQIEV